MKVWVVFCHEGGCDDCSGGIVIVGVYDNITRAEQVAKEHGRLNHLHSPYIDTKEIILNDVIKPWRAGACSQ